MFAKSLNRYLKLTLFGKLLFEKLVFFPCFPFRLSFLGPADANHLKYQALVKLIKEVVEVEKPLTGLLAITAFIKETLDVKGLH